MINLNLQEEGGGGGRMGYFISKLKKLLWFAENPYSSYA